MAFEEFDLNGPLVRSWLEELGKLFPPGRTAVRDAMKTGDLSTKLKDKDFHKATTDWATKTADPKDQEQRLEMVAVLKAMPPDDPLRTAIFQKAFNTKLESGVRRYEVVIDPRTKKPRVDPRTKVELPPAEKYTKGPLDPAAMNEMADIMAQLPIAHMPKGWNLVGQDVDKNTRGSYNDDVDMAELNFSLLDTKVGFEQEYSAGGGCLPGDPLEKAKAFDLLIRHECGHKAGTKLARELTSLPFAGEWKCPGTTEAAWRPFVGTSPGAGCEKDLPVRQFSGVSQGKDVRGWRPGGPVVQLRKGGMGQASFPVPICDTGRVVRRILCHGEQRRCRDPKGGQTEVSRCLELAEGQKVHRGRRITRRRSPQGSHGCSRARLQEATAGETLAQERAQREGFDDDE